MISQVTGPSMHSMRRSALWAIALVVIVSAGPAVHARQSAADRARAGAGARLAQRHDGSAGGARRGVEGGSCRRRVCLPPRGGSTGGCCAPRPRSRRLLSTAKSPAYAAEAQVPGLGASTSSRAGRRRTRFPDGTRKWRIARVLSPLLRPLVILKPDWYLPHVGLGDIFKAKRQGNRAANQEFARAAALGRPDAAPGLYGPTRRHQERPAGAAVARGHRARPGVHCGAPRLAAAARGLRCAVTAYQATPTTPLRTCEGDRRADCFRLIRWLRSARTCCCRGEQLPQVERLLSSAGAAASASSARTEQLQARWESPGLAPPYGRRVRRSRRLVSHRRTKALAEKRLAEASRLSRGLDATNQSHLGELSKAKGDLETARAHYPTVLGLAGASGPQRETRRPP